MSDSYTVAPDSFREECELAPPIVFRRQAFNTGRMEVDTSLPSGVFQTGSLSF